jgi:dihydrofolate reductase
MRKLSVFNNVSLDGYFVDGSGDMSWAHKQDAEWNEFVAGNASDGGALVLGRVTYEMMAGFWPTPAALAMNPGVAERMNSMPKVVFSRTLDKASWNNTRVLKGDISAEMRKLKAETGPDMTILGSGSIVAQLASAGLIDDYQLVVHPLALGSGRTLFQGIPKRLGLTLKKTRAFGNGAVVLGYQPAPA